MANIMNYKWLFITDNLEERKVVDSLTLDIIKYKGNKLFELIGIGNKEDVTFVLLKSGKYVDVLEEKMNLERYYSAIMLQKLGGWWSFQLQLCMKVFSEAFRGIEGAIIDV